MKKIVLVVVIITMCSNLFAQKSGMAVEKDNLSGRITGEGEVKNNKEVGIWKYYSKDGSSALADYGDGTGEPITKYFDRKGQLVFIGDHYVVDFFLRTFRVSETDDEPYQYFIGFEYLKEKFIVLNGLWKEYNENEVMISKTNLIDGNKDGIEEFYYDSGNLKRKCYHHNGQLDLETCRYYDENGNERSYDLELASVLYYDNKDYKNAFTHFNEAAKDGDLIAKQFLAMMYEDGQGVEKNLDLAIKLYEELCNKNISRTCKALETIHLKKAVSYLEKEQYTKAIVHLKEAAKNGNLDAQYNLAVMYHTGMGTDIDLDYATQLYNKLCDKNHFSACLNLGLLYLDNETLIMKEINSLGSSSADNARYEELKSQRKNICKQALKSLEKAYKLKPNEDLLATINNLKSILE
ncbi:hypothetical protein [Psychroserpens sp. SPM9]|uniref:hypothetical protein n=1 Tax=Psychroserpens sp. SPM9 TaxID=2975598 RepID=UPI0021A7FC45|nr:hypothetical protein [Psychroserpens sp. SPM9]MDG5493029.1 hypothetical protein [Psychroserpens sp. SPM9]